MTDRPPTVSVIIPTHNRADSLMRSIRSLERQTYPARDLELIVVADGCEDDTESLARSHRAAFPIHVLAQEGRGAAAARNVGAAAARGQLLLFIDDDIEPSPELVAAHVQTHDRRPDSAVIGPYPPSLGGRTTFFRTGIRSWWVERFETLKEPGHRFDYRDLLSGNLSIKAEQYWSLGGFNDTIHNAHEDYEFGVRLLRAGMDLVFAPDAAALHHEHETMTLDGSLQRARKEGIANVTIGRLHPELRFELFSEFEESQSKRYRTLRYLLFRRPRLGRMLAKLGRDTLPLLERFRMRHRWRKLHEALFAYWYWRGVAEALGDAASLSLYLQDAPVPPDRGADEIELDLSAGLESAEQQLDSLRPTCARLRFGSQELGYIPPVSCSERLRGAHLRPMLATRFAFEMLRALAARGTVLMDSHERLGS